MSSVASKTKIGLYSPSETVQRLIEEQFDKNSTLEMIFFSEAESLELSLKKKDFSGYLWDRSPSSLCFSWHTFLGGKEHKVLIPRPFRLNLLFEKLQQIEREDVLRVGPYFFNKKQRFLIKEEGAQIQLREKEAELLLFLLEAPHQKADRQTLLQHVWGYPKNTQTHTLETHVYHLRQKIEENPTNPTILVSEGSGYRLAL